MKNKLYQTYINFKLWLSNILGLNNRLNRIVEWSSNFYHINGMEIEKLERRVKFLEDVYVSEQMAELQNALEEALTKYTEENPIKKPIKKSTKKQVKKRK